jgi:hypothetical protein
LCAFTGKSFGVSKHTSYASRIGGYGVRERDREGRREREREKERERERLKLS